MLGVVAAVLAGHAAAPVAAHLLTTPALVLEDPIRRQRSSKLSKRLSLQAQLKRSGAAKSLVDGAAIKESAF